MPVIKQTSAVKGKPSNYRITTLDGQTPKPYPLWKYTWILPEGVDAEFKSVSTGFPMVIVQWNETSQPGSPFKLKCQVETDADDCCEVNCVVDAIINVSVGEEIVNLNTDVWGATGACIKVGDNTQDSDVTYYAKCSGAKSIIWNVVNGKIRTGIDLVYGPYSTLTDYQGNASITVNWLDGSTHNISAYGVDINGNTSPQSIYPTYPAPSIDAQIDGLTTKTLGDGNAIFNFTVNNVKSFNPNFNVIYNIYVGTHNTTGPVNSDLSYNWELKVLTDVGLKVQDILTNVFTKQYTLDDVNIPGRWGIKFKPLFVSNTDVTCRSERTLVKYFTWVSGTFTPIFMTGPTSERIVEYVPIFRNPPIHGRLVSYTPIFQYAPFSLNTTGTEYVPLFMTGPYSSLNIEYTPTFINAPTGTKVVTYVPSFMTGPTKDRAVIYTPIFVNTPVAYLQPEYSPTFINAPTGTRNVTYSPVFMTGPTKTRMVEYVPIFRDVPVAYLQPEYSPTFINAPTGTRNVTYSPVFMTGPTKTRMVEYVPIFRDVPVAYLQSPYTPTFINAPTGTKVVTFVPIFQIPPNRTRVVEYVPIFINTPYGGSIVT